MTARTHDLAAISALGGLLLIYPIGSVTLATGLVAIFANQVGGIAPDLDQPTAPFWRNLPIGGYFGKITGKLLGGHRFLTHSLLGVVLLSFLSKELLLFLHPIMPRVDTKLVWWAFLVGMLSHLVMDSFTKEGVPWLLPIPVKFGFPPVKKLRITTGKAMEKVLFFAIITIDTWFIWSHYDHVVEAIRRTIARG